MKSCKLILLHLACAILLMHNFVPHVHHDELTEQAQCPEHSSVDSLLDLIRIAFHSDMGEGHLDHFIISDGLQKDVDKKADILSQPLNFICTLPSPTVAPEEINDINTTPPILLFDFTNSTRPQRGPPSLS